MHAARARTARTAHTCTGGKRDQTKDKEAEEADKGGMRRDVSRCRRRREAWGASRGSGQVEEGNGEASEGRERTGGAFLERTEMRT